jgi:hypothetical protein
VKVPSAALTAEGQEVEDVAVFHLAVRAYGFKVAALHHGEALVGCGCHGSGVGGGRYMKRRSRADRSRKDVRGRSRK